MIKINKQIVEQSFDILNLIVFEPCGMKVPIPEHLDIAPLECYLGFVMKVRVDHKDWTMCVMNEWFEDWDHFTEIMAHEMIHVYQVMVLGTYGYHDEFFWSWKEKFDEFGIPLREGEV